MKKLQFEDVIELYNNGHKPSANEVSLNALNRKVWLMSGCASQKPYDKQVAYRTKKEAEDSAIFYLESATGTHLPYDAAEILRKHFCLYLGNFHVRNDHLKVSDVLRRTPCIY